jgi:hypothetical protein
MKTPRRREPSHPRYKVFAEETNPAEEPRPTTIPTNERGRRRIGKATPCSDEIDAWIRRVEEETKPAEPSWGKAPRGLR